MLHSQRLILKLLEEVDTEYVIKWRNQREIINNLFSHRGITVAEHINWFKRYIESKDRVEFVIVKKEDGKKIGTIGLSNIDYRNQKAEYGIMLGEIGEWGKGYAKEASICIVNYAFYQLNLQKVYLKVFQDNNAAVNMYRKLGFIEEGLFRRDIFKNGDFKDILAMSIFRNDWNIEND